MAKLSGTSDFLKERSAIFSKLPQKHTRIEGHVAMCVTSFWITSKGNRFVLRFELLRHQHSGEITDAGDVPARSFEAGDKSNLDRVGPPSNTIGMVVVAALAANAAWTPPATITATGRPTKSPAKDTQSIVLSLRPAVFDRHILPLDSLHLNSKIVCK
jgi:hypothetical protein